MNLERLVARAFARRWSTAKSPRQSPTPTHPAVTDPGAWGYRVANQVVNAAYAPHDQLGDWSAEDEANWQALCRRLGKPDAFRKAMGGPE